MRGGTPAACAVRTLTDTMLPRQGLRLLQIRSATKSLANRESDVPSEPYPPSSTSLWADTLASPPPVRTALPGDRDADVVIVGGGFTGLWTAYYLAHTDPALRIVVLEAETVGFGASGRNGGWCSGLFPVGRHRLARLAGADAARAMYRELQRTVDEVGGSPRMKASTPPSRRAGASRSPPGPSTWPRCARWSTTSGPGAPRRTTCAGSTPPRPPGASARRPSSVAPGPRTARGCTRHDWCTGWQRRPRRPASSCTSGPAWSGSSRASCTPRADASGPTSSCAPPRGTRLAARPPPDAGARLLVRSSRRSRFRPRSGTTWAGPAGRP